MKIRKEEIEIEVEGKKVFFFLTKLLGASTRDEFGRKPNAHVKKFIHPVAVWPNLKFTDSAFLAHFFLFLLLFWPQLHVDLLQTINFWFYCGKFDFFLFYFLFFSPFDLNRSEFDQNDFNCRTRIVIVGCDRVVYA